MIIIIISGNKIDELSSNPVLGSFHLPFVHEIRMLMINIYLREKFSKMTMLL